MSSVVLGWEFGIRCEWVGGLPFRLDLYALPDDLLSHALKR